MGCMICVWVDRGGTVSGFEGRELCIEVDQILRYYYYIPDLYKYTCRFILTYLHLSPSSVHLFIALFLTQSADPLTDKQVYRIKADHIENTSFGKLTDKTTRNLADSLHLSGRPRIEDLCYSLSSTNSARAGLRGLSNYWECFNSSLFWLPKTTSLSYKKCLNDLLSFKLKLIHNTIVNRSR